MSAIESRLEQMGLTLPAPLTPPPGVTLPFELVRVHGGLAYISGHGPFDGDRLLFTGSVGTDVTGWVKALGFVKCGEGFDVTPAAINGFSELILELWGDAGRHARSAIGAGELPFGMSVEVEAIATVAAAVA